MGEPGGFGVPDHVLSAGAMTLSELERGDVLAACVGDERCAGILRSCRTTAAGRRDATAATHDQPGSVGPGVEVHKAGELDHFGAVTQRAVGVDGGVPTSGRHADDAVADAFVDP